MSGNPSKPPESVDVGKATTYFQQILPQVVQVIIDPEARAKFGQQPWLEAFVLSAFDVKDGRIVSTDLQRVIGSVDDFYRLHMMILGSDVPLRFSVELLAPQHISPIAACANLRDSAWAQRHRLTF